MSIDLRSVVSATEWAQLRPAREVHPALRRLLPTGLRSEVYSLTGTASVAFGLLTSGWCGVVGLPELGMEAAQEWGVDLNRLVVVPRVGSWVETTASLIEGLDVVLAPAPTTIAPATAQRLTARVRSRSATLIVLGDWPQALVKIHAETCEWSGLGRGHGYLESQRIAVTVTSRHTVRQGVIVRGCDGITTG